MQPSVTFSVPAGLHRTLAVLEQERRIREYGKGIQVQAYDTVQGLQWNGGRLIFNREFIKDETHPAYSTLTPDDLKIAVDRAKSLNQAGISFNLVLNSTLESIDPDDEAGNLLLEKLHDSLNGVTIASKAMRRLISERYPLYQTTASICFAFTQIEQYRAACEAYDKVVVMPTLAYTPDQLEGLPLDKLVFILNDSCYLFCPRKDHYDYISRCCMSGNSSFLEQKRNFPRGGCFLKNRSYWEQVQKMGDPEIKTMIEGIRQKQLEMDGLKEEDDMEAQFTITPVARKKLIQLGISTFKLQGRDYSDEIFQEKVLDFMAKVVREEL